MLTGTARSGADGLTHVELDGGGTVTSTEPGDGRGGGQRLPVGDRHRARGRRAARSAQNRLPAEVLSVTTVGNRVRLGLAGPQPLVAEITQASAERLELHAGARVTATWKAAATRLVAI